MLSAWDAACNPGRTSNWTTTLGVLSMLTATAMKATAATHQLLTLSNTGIGPWPLYHLPRPWFVHCHPATINMSDHSSNVTMETSENAHRVPVRSGQAREVAEQDVRRLRRHCIAIRRRCEQLVHLQRPPQNVSAHQPVGVCCLLDAPASAEQVGM